MMRFWRAVDCLLLTGVCAALLLGGCGGSGGPELVPVQGKITFGGGAWPKEGTLLFSPVEAAPGLPKRPGTAHFGVNGKFRAGSFKEADGLIPGHYKISAVCWEVAPVLDGPPAKSYVPAKYQSAATSGLEVTVNVGTPQTGLIFDVPKP